MSENPTNWSVTKLREIIIDPKSMIVDGPFGSNLKASEYKFSGVPILRLQNVKALNFIDKNVKYITKDKAEQLKRHSYIAGDIVITKLGAPLGEACILPPNLEDGVIVADLVRLRLDHTHIDKKWLCYCINSNQIAKQFKLLTKGTTRPRVNLNHIRDLKINLPPYSEQQRIVGRIEELFSELDKGIDNLKVAREQLRIYRRTLLKKLFDDEALTPKPLSEFVLDMGQGWSPKCFETPSPSIEIWGVIRTTAIQHLHFNESANKELPASLPPRKHLEIQENDILITRAGPRNRVGVACLVKKVRPKLILCDKAYRIKADEDQIIPEFLIAILNTPRAQKEIEELKSGISDSGLNLTQKRFLELEVRVPDIKVQQRLLDSFELQNDQIREAERIVEEQLISVEALRQSILKAAFSGKLVPQDPNDEPASVLLERIKAERTKTMKQKGGSSRGKN